VKNRLSQKVSSHGLRLKTKTELPNSEIGFIDKLVSEFNSIYRPFLTPFYPIPSDTGLVLLRRDGMLVATKDISPNSVVTYVTVTNRIHAIDQVQNPVIMIDMVAATIIKKLTPFGGFGAFAKWASTKTNCSVSRLSARKKLFVLVSESFIPAWHEIVCSNSCLVHVSSSETDKSVDFQSYLKQKIKEYSVETRSAAQHDVDQSGDETE